MPKATDVVSSSTQGVFSAVCARAGAPPATTNINAAEESVEKRMRQIPFASGSEIRRCRSPKYLPDRASPAKILIKILSGGRCSIDLSQPGRRKRDGGRVSFEFRKRHR